MLLDRERKFRTSFVTIPWIMQLRKLSSKVDERDDDTDRILDLPVNGDGCGQVEYRLEINRHEKRGLAERGYALP